MLSPSLVDYELAKLALKKVRRRPAEAPRIAVALHAARALPIRRVAVPGFEAFALARQTGPHGVRCGISLALPRVRRRARDAGYGAEPSRKSMNRRGAA
jgi:hypothetical protein